MYVKVKAFTCDPKNFVATNAMRHAFLDEGYLLVRGLFDEEEIANIRQALEGSQLFSNTLYAVPDCKVRECRNYTDLSGKDFLDPSTDNTVKVADN
ncbi:hypothetical protein ACOMHN_032779 [Nucella lapillus]